MGFNIYFGCTIGRYYDKDPGIGPLVEVLHRVNVHVRIRIMLAE